MHQISCGDKPIQIDIEDAEKSVSAIRPISKTTETTTQAISLAGAAASQLDTINSFLEPLSIFNTVVNTIANVRLLRVDNRVWLTITFRSTRTLSWLWRC